MSVTTEHGDHVDPDYEGYEHDGHADSYYIKIAVILAVITGLEVALSYADVGPIFLPALLIMMAIKFTMVVLFFMHLKFDSMWFNMAFWTGLGMTLIVYLGTLATFEFFLR